MRRGSLRGDLRTCNAAGRSDDPRRRSLSLGSRPRPLESAEEAREPPSVTFGISRLVLPPTVGLVDRWAINPGPHRTSVLVVGVDVVDDDCQTAAGQRLGAW